LESIKSDLIEVNKKLTALVETEKSLNQQREVLIKPQNIN